MITIMVILISMARSQRISLKQKYKYFIGTICIYFHANIYYHISMKGEYIYIYIYMTQFEKLDLLLHECGGTIQTFQVLNNGISKSVFYAYVKERGLEQAVHGVYVSPDTWTDAMYILHLRCSQAVFSHETALFFHDLTDREPLKYTITVRTGYNPSRLQEDGFQVYTVKKDLHETGITTMQTPFGHSVPVYDMERTICDLLRSRNNIEMQVFQDALKQYARRKDKNLRTLMKYASMFHVEKILRPYLEVLL